MAERKEHRLSSETLSLEYSLGYTDLEIAKKYSLSERSVCRLRGIYGIVTNPQYRYNRNPLRWLPLSEYQRNVLHGTLFGDSLIALQGSGTGYWRCMHGVTQSVYLRKKADVFKPFVSKVFCGSRPFEKFGKNFPFIAARTFSLPQFTEYRNKFYPGGKKFITEGLLKELTPTGFAYWWMDDGLASEHTFNIVTYEPLFRNAAVEDVFKEILGLNVHITWYHDEGNICILRGSHERAWEYIKPEITQDLMYKLPRKFR